MDYFSDDEFVPDLEAPVKMMELFAGIGGMRSAAEAAGYHLVAVHPYEINPSALVAYSHNFSDGVDEGRTCQTGPPLKNGNKKAKSHKSQRNARNLLGLTMKEWDGLQTDLLTMSPPCQPFTRQGLQLDTSDPRNKPLAHILALLCSADRLPPMLLLENVKGFETSAARAEVVRVVSQRGYLWQEFLLCPSQLGVPNSRLRYYLVAVLPPAQPRPPPPEGPAAVERDFPVCLCLRGHQNPASGKCLSCSRVIIPRVSALLHDFHFSDASGLGLGREADDYRSSPATYADVIPTLEQFLHTAPNLQTSLPNHTAFLQEQNVILTSSTSSEKPELDREMTCSGDKAPKIALSCNLDSQSQCGFSISNSHFCDSPSQDLSHFELKPKVLAKYAMLLDIVDDKSRRTCCFTKGYGRLVEGSGSVYNPRGKAELDAAFQNWVSEIRHTDKSCTDRRSLNHDVDCRDHPTSARAIGSLSGHSTPADASDAGSGEASKRTFAGADEASSGGATEVNSAGVGDAILERNLNGKNNFEDLIDSASSVVASGNLFPADKNHSVDESFSSSSVKSEEHPSENKFPLETNANHQSLSPLLSLKLRHFTPVECLRLMCFPSSFSFPSSLTPRQQYQLIGNSVNVLVVTVLLMYLRDWRRRVQRQHVVHGDSTKS